MMPERSPLVILTKRWKHHSRSGGYHQLANYLAPAELVSSDNQKNNRIHIYSRKLLWRFFPETKGLNLYNWPDAANEWKIIQKLKKHPGGIIHALYAEDQLCYLLKKKHLHQYVVAGSFHMPAESPWFQRAQRNGALKIFENIDAGIVVSRSMLSDYEPWIDKKKLFFVPHGIDTTVFIPGKRKDVQADEKLKLLIVGGHGRDWETVKKTAEELEKSNANVEFKAVVPKSKKDYFEGVHCVHVFSGISEERLIALYQQSDLVFLPVCFATANNALLEAIACGTPVISTKTGGVPDYLDEQSGWLLGKHDVRAAVSLIAGLADNRHVIIEKGHYARKKAIQYDWNKISLQISEVYAAVCRIKNS